METNLASVADGAFALECPACPHPGRNLPEGWDQAPEETRYVRTPYFPPQNSLNRFPGGCTRISLPLMRTSG